jgi:hypothetical protein
MEDEKIFKKGYRQIHVLTNINLCKRDFGIFFEELFKPAQKMISLISHNRNLIGLDFISITFRFQQLLGDFLEGNYQILNEQEQTVLIGKCIRHLKEIYKKNKHRYNKCLITSDSLKFLSICRNFDFVYVVPGIPLHTAYSLNTNKLAYMKSFLDYFLLQYAKKVYLVVEDKMYESGFAHTASLHNKVPYIVKRY